MHRSNNFDVEAKLVVFNYPNKAVVEMHSDKLGRQVRVTGGIFPGDAPDDIFSRFTAVPVEILP